MEDDAVQWLESQDHSSLAWVLAGAAAIGLVALLLDSIRRKRKRARDRHRIEHLSHTNFIVRFVHRWRRRFGNLGGELAARQRHKTAKGKRHKRRSWSRHHRSSHHK